MADHASGEDQSLIDREGMIVGMIVGERDWSSPEAWSAIKEIIGLH